MAEEKRQNVVLARGINAISANSLAKTNGRFFARQHTTSIVKSASVDASKKSSSSRPKPAKWYPVDFIPRKLASAKTERNSKKPAKLRESITPGTILILLSGRFRGKRVVFLKQLASGTLLVTGPYKVNGVPLRRVNQAFVIATSTKVDLDGLSFPSIDDRYFVKDKSSGKAKGSDQQEAQFFAQQSNTRAVVSDQRKKDQHAVDAALMQKIGNEPYLKAYLNAKFTLTKHDRVHELQF